MTRQITRRMTHQLIITSGSALAGCGVVAAPVWAEAPLTFSAETVARSSLPNLADLEATNISAERQGQALYQSGDYNAAITAWQTASQTYAMQQNILGQARSLSHMALAQQHQGDWGGARVALSTSWALLSGLEGPAAEQTRGQVLQTRATLHFTLGDRTAALEDWQTASDHYQAANYPLGQWQSQLALAQAQASSGQRETALATVARVNKALEQAVLESDPAPFKRLQILARHQWGDLLRQQGQWQAAQTQLNQALQLLEKRPKQQSRESLASQDSALLGQLWLSLGHAARDQALAQQASLAAAEAFYQKAVDITETEILARLALMAIWDIQVQNQAQNQARNQAQNSNNQQKNSRDQQQSTWTKVKTLLATVPPQRRHLYSRIQLLYQLDHAPQPEALEALAYETVHQAYALEDQRVIAQALGALAHVYGQQQQWDKAKSLTQEAMELADGNHRPTLFAHLQRQLGDLLWQQMQTQADNPAQQQEAHTAAIAAYEAARQTLSQTSPTESPANSAPFPAAQYQAQRQAYDLLMTRLKSTPLPLGAAQQRSLGQHRNKLRSLEFQTLLREMESDAPELLLGSLTAIAPVLP